MQFSTGSSIEAKFRSLCDPAGRDTATRSLIVVVADRAPTAVTESQLQFVMETAARIVDATPVAVRPVLVFIIHFPPELGTSSPLQG